MTTDPNLGERAFQAGRKGAGKPKAATEVEQRVVDGFYRAGLREAGRPVPGLDSVEEWQQREGRIVERHTRAAYGTPGPERKPIGVEGPHEPGEPGG